MLKSLWFEFGPPCAALWQQLAEPALAAVICPMTADTSFGLLIREEMIQGNDPALVRG